MKKQIITCGIIAGIIAVLVGVYVWFSSGNDHLQRYPILSFNEEQYYKIDPESLLTSLENNERTLFQPEPDVSSEKITEKPISWRQEDYNKIANKIHEYALHESLDGWKLYRMQFGTACQDNPTGFDQADFVYFREVSVEGGREYTAQGINITPQYGDITVGSDTNFPRPFWGWKYIKTDTVNITAEEALQMAEKRDGKEARLAMSNKCRIYVSMNPEGYGHNYWSVSYSGNGNPADYDTVFPSHK